MGKPLTPTLAAAVRRAHVYLFTGGPRLHWGESPGWKMFEQPGLYRQGGWGIKRRRAARARYDREAQRACDRGHSRLGWRRAAAANAAFARGRSAAGRVMMDWLRFDAAGADAQRHVAGGAAA